MKKPQILLATGAANKPAMKPELLCTSIAVAMAVQFVAVTPAAVWHEAPAQLFPGWVRHASSLQQNESNSQNRIISFHLSVKQQGLDKILQRAMEVSDPSSPSYGKYMNQPEIDAITAPSENDLASSLAGYTSKVPASKAPARKVENALGAGRRSLCTSNAPFVLHAAC